MQGEDDDAEQLYRQSLEIDSQLGPSAHARVASDLSRLASLYADQGLEGRAKPLYRRAFDIRAATLGPTHPAALDTLATIAALASGHGREAAAQSLPLHGYVLHVMEKVHGPMAAPLAPALLAAAKSHAAAANVDAALPLAIRALAINTVAMGEHHADTLRMGITVGELQRTLGALDEAAATLERTVTGAAAALGEDHPTVAAALCAMGNVRLQQGQPSEALQLCARARCATDSLQAKTTAAAGETLAATAVALRAQGALLLRCGVREAAVAAYEKALATAEATHGPTHPAVAGVAIQLAYALLDVSCKQRDAEDMVASLATETVESSSPTFTVTDPSIAAADRSGDSAADTATSMTAARAVALAHRSVAITMNQLGSRVHPKVGEALDDLAAVLTAAGQDEEAAAVVARKVAAAAEWAESPLAHTADCCQSGRRIGGGRTGRHAAALACFHMRQMSSSSMLDMLCSDQLLPKIDSTASPGRLCIREVRSSCAPSLR
jgi:tetratricopeptide (TPR) repeat protein